MNRLQQRYEHFLLLNISELLANGTHKATSSPLWLPQSNKDDVWIPDNGVSITADEMAAWFKDKAKMS